MSPFVKLIRDPLELAVVHLLFLDILEEMRKYYVKEVIDEEILLYTRSKFIKKYSQNSCLVFALIIDNEIVGFQLISIESGVVTFEWSGVSVGLRGLRLGSILKNKIEKHIKSHHLGHKIICDCLITNTESINNLNRSGFEIVSIVKNHWGHQDYYFWEKYIS